MQIGPVKYSKKEETIFFTSYLLALPLGLPIGIVLNYLVGFPTLQESIPKDFLKNFVFFFIWLNRLEIVWFLVAMSVVLFRSRKGRNLNSLRDIGKIVWALFVVFPVLNLYVVLIMSAFFIPLYSATSWLSPVRQYWLGALLFLPFLFLFMLIFLPDQKPRKITVRLWLILKGEASIPKLKVRSVIVSLLILLWLVLVFLPLPNVPLVNLTLIAGGLLVVAYLAKQRYQTKKK
jgi:hypothetical protein